jgi:23S rRNA pseudouridine1911/1915/1917 synthase
MITDEEDFIELDEEEFEHFHFKADNKQQQLRIDLFLIDRIPNTSRTKIQDATAQGYIKVNGKEVKSNYKVKPNDEIVIVLPYPKREIELIPENIPLDIVFEDDDLMIINKSPGLVVHPGHGNYTGTLVNALMYHLKDLPLREGNHFRPGIVHRIDKNTSGLMVIAKTPHALAFLSKQFFDRTIERKYIALIWGNLAEDTGTIEGNVGRNLKNRKIMQVFPDGEQGKTAITHYKVIKKMDYITLVECKLATGRTHQIRVHFKHIGHPLFGDDEYGGNKVLKGTTFAKYKQFVENCFKILPRQALHAKSIGLIHPTTKEYLFFESPLPNDMQEVLDKWENYLSTR